MKKIMLPLMAFAFTSCDLLTQSKSEPSNVTAPKSEPTSFETNDSSYLKIKVDGNSFQVEFLKEVSNFAGVSSLDTFFQNNSKLINAEKIVIVSTDTFKTNTELNTLLQKHGIERFRVSKQ